MLEVGVNLIKLSAEVGLGEIFQKPFEICFLTFVLKVSGGGGGPISGLRISENPVFEGAGLS